MQVHTRLADHIIPLSAKGRTEALACGTFLAEYFSSSLSTTEEAWQRRIIVSPYKRARETASAIVQSAGQFIGDITESVLAGEQQFGLFEGLPVSKIASVFPLENRYFEKAIASGGIVLLLFMSLFYFGSSIPHDVQDDSGRAHPLENLALTCAFVPVQLLI